MSDNTPLVSVVLPVYNVRNHFQRCLDSLASLDYSPLEIILVDDHSPDDCGEMCDAFSESHPEATVIHFEENKGVSFARKAGFDHSSGEFVMFVDSDDYVHPGIISKMVSKALTYDADVVCCQLSLIYGSSETVLSSSIFGVFGKEEIQELMSSRMLFDFEIGSSGMPMYLFGKLFRRGVLSSSLTVGLGLRFGEDTLIVSDIMLNQANKLVCLNEPLYYYVHHPDQITKRHFIELWPMLSIYWERLDLLGGDVLHRQLVPKIWRYLKPTIYDSRKNWGGFFVNNRFVSTFREVRNSRVVRKHIWDNPDLPDWIKRHPHFVLLKLRLYWLDFMMYSTLWMLNKSK